MKVKEVLEVGVVLDLAPGTEAFVHVSELDERFVSDARELFAPGDVMDVLVLRPGDRGNFRCSRRVLKLLQPSTLQQLCCGYVSA